MSGDLVLKEERHSKTSAKSSNPLNGGNDIEMANIGTHDRDVDVSASGSVFSSPRHLLTNTVT